MNKKYNIDEIIILQPVFSKQKSFYGKAKTVKAGEATQLVSYDTEIAEIENGKIKMLCGSDTLSMTVLKHLREFLRQLGFGDIAELTKKQIIKELY